MAGGVHVNLYLLVYMYYFCYTLVPGKEMRRRGIPVKMRQGEGNTCFGLIIARASVGNSVRALPIDVLFLAENQSAAGHVSPSLSEGLASIHQDTHFSCDRH